MPEKNSNTITSLPHKKPTSKLLTPAEVSDILGVSVETLAVWRCVKRYQIPFVKVGRLVRYRADAIEAFLSRREVSA